jgi:hypothetical protein
MYGSAAQQVIREHYEDLRREAARARPTRMALEERETRPYVVRDLSWELARFLDAEDFRATAFATPGGANGNPPRPK